MNAKELICKVVEEQPAGQFEIQQVTCTPAKRRSQQGKWECTHSNAESEPSHIIAMPPDRNAWCQRAVAEFAPIGGQLAFPEGFEPKFPKGFEVVPTDLVDCKLLEGDEVKQAIVCRGTHAEWKCSPSRAYIEEVNAYKQLPPLERVAQYGIPPEGKEVEEYDITWAPEVRTLKKRTIIPQEGELKTETEEEGRRAAKVQQRKELQAYINARWGLCQLGLTSTDATFAMWKRWMLRSGSFKFAEMAQTI